MTSVNDKLAGNRISPLHSVHSSMETTASEKVGREMFEESPPGCFGRVQRAWRLATQGTVVSSIFILLTTCVGAGTLSLPYAFVKGGLIFSSVVFFIIMLTSIHIGGMLFAGKRYAAEVYPHKEVWGYADLAQVAFGTLGKIAVLLTIAILLFLALIAYMIYARDQLEAIVSFALIQAGQIPACSPLINCAVLMCIAFLPVFPVTLLRNLSPLQFTSYFSVLCVIFVAIAMTVNTGIFWATTVNMTLADHHIQLEPVNFQGSLTVISYCSLSFICHFNLLPLQKELKGKVTKGRLYAMIVGSIGIAYVLYNVVIFAGYFRFFNNVKTDVMVGYPKNDGLMIAARTALFLMLVTSYPVLLHPTRDSINNVIFLVKDMISKALRKRSSSSVNGNESVKLLDEEGASLTVTPGNTRIPTLIWFCETWIIFALSFLPASFIPNVGYVWNFVGSIGGVLVLFIYPAACYLRLRYVRFKRRAELNDTSYVSQYSAADVLKEIIAWAILITGFVLLGVENYQAIDAVLNTSHEPSGLCYQLECKAASDWNTTVSTQRDWWFM